MKTKILFVLISLGTFNYFLASTYDWNLSNFPTAKKERNISVQVQELDNFWSLSGNVSLLTDITDGELKLLLFPYGVCNLEEDPYCFSEKQPIADLFVETDGTFAMGHVEEGRYSVVVVVEKEDKTYVKMEAIALGGINLEDFFLDNEIDIQIAISYPTKTEIVYR